MITHLLSSIRDLVTYVACDVLRASGKHTMVRYGQPMLLAGMVCLSPCAPALAQAAEKPTMTAIPPELVDPMFFNDNEEATPPSSLAITPVPAAEKKIEKALPAVKTPAAAQVPSNEKVEIIPKAPAAPTATTGKIKLPKIDLPKAVVKSEPAAPINDDYSPEALKTLLKDPAGKDNLTLLPATPSLPLTPMPEAAPLATIIPDSPSAEVASPDAQKTTAAEAPADDPQNNLWRGSLMFPADRIELLNQAARGNGSASKTDGVASLPGGGNPGAVYPTVAPVFYLNSILYFSSTNWTVWLNGSKISYAPTPPNLSPIPDLNIISVSPKEITVTWTTQFLDHTAPRWSEALTSDGDGNFSNDDETVSLNAAKDVIQFTLRPNQAFATHFMGIYEGDVEPTILPPPTPEQKTFMQNTTDEKIDKIKNIITP